MPAIQPARLRQQASLVAQHFGDPAALIRSLHYLFDSYAERVRRPGRTGKPGPISPAYNVPDQVLRFLLQEIEPKISSDLQAGLDMCDALWEQQHLEFRLLAGMLLNQISAVQPEWVLQRLQGWIKPQLEDLLIDTLLEKGLARIRQRSPQLLVELSETLLDRESSFEIQVGLRVLLPLIREPGFENLPVFFRLLQPLCQEAPNTLRPDLLDALEALIQKSPQETAHFLRQTLSLPDSPGTPWLVRQLIGSFPEEHRQSLRRASRTFESSLS